MKKHILILFVFTLLMSCSEEETPNRDLIVFNTTYFKSEPYTIEVPIFDGIGGNDTKEEIRHRVVRFKEGGEIEYFTIDKYNEIIAGIKSGGYYKLDYPRIYDISNVSTDKETVVENQAGKLVIYLDGLKYTSSIEKFK